VNIEGARVLVVDDHPDAARLLGKLLRSAGYQVAETTEHQLAVTTLLDEPEPVDAVVASFTTSGTRASLRLLDTIRNHPEPRINGLRALLVSDQPRQQIFCLQAGADAVLLRPYHADTLARSLEQMLTRSAADRVAYRRRAVEQLKQDFAASGPSGRVAQPATPSRSTMIS